MHSYALIRAEKLSLHKKNRKLISFTSLFRLKFEIFRVVNRLSISDYSYVATCRYAPKNFQATTTIQTTCSQCSHVATWPDYMTL